MTRNGLNNYNNGESGTIWFEFDAWNASNSIVKQNHFKNKTTWLTQSALSKSCSLFRTTYIEDIIEFFKGLLLCSKLALTKKLRKEIAFKFFEKCGIKDCEWPEKRITCGMTVNDPKKG